MAQTQERIEIMVDGEIFKGPVDDLREMVAMKGWEVSVDYDVVLVLEPNGIYRDVVACGVMRIEDILAQDPPFFFIPEYGTLDDVLDKEVLLYA